MKKKEYKINDTIKVSKEVEATLNESKEKQRAIENAIVVLSQKLHQERKEFWNIIKINYPGTARLRMMYAQDKGVLTLVGKLNENEETE